MDHTNFYITGNLAYTKCSDILIHNIFAYSISDEIELVDLQNYFQTFGGQVHKLNGSRAAFIHFENAFMAASVLAIDSHTILHKNFRFSVKACDSFLQPYKTQQKYMHKIIQIIDFNDEILLDLFSFLSIKDQLSLVCSHKRFQQFFKTYAKRYVKEIKQDELGILPDSAIHHLFELAGEFIQTLSLPPFICNKDRDNAIDLITLNCPNLENLSINGYTTCNESFNGIINKNRFDNLLLKTQKLKILRLEHLKLEDSYISSIKSLPQTEQLSLCFCINITGSSLMLLTQLKRLKLDDMERLQPCHLREIFLKLNNLYAFSLTFSDIDPELAFEFVKILMENPRNIEILEWGMPGLDNYIRIRNFPKLKSFSLINVTKENYNYSELFQSIDQLNQLTTLIIQHEGVKLSSADCNLISRFINLTKLHLSGSLTNDSGLDDSCLKLFKRLTNLVELKISYSRNVSGNGLLPLIENCKKIKWVNAEYTSINNQLIRNVIGLVRLENRPNGRITFLVHCTWINKFYGFPQEYFSKEIQQLVYLVFDRIDNLKCYDNLEDVFENDGNLIHPPFFSV